MVGVKTHKRLEKPLGMNHFLPNLLLYYSNKLIKERVNCLKSHKFWDFFYPHLVALDFFKRSRTKKADFAGIDISYRRLRHFTIGENWWHNFFSTSPKIWIEYLYLICPLAFPPLQAHTHNNTTNNQVIQQVSRCCYESLIFYPLMECQRTPSSME